MLYWKDGGGSPNWLYHTEKIKKLCTYIHKILYVSLRTLLITNSCFSLVAFVYLYVLHNFFSCQSCNLTFYEVWIPIPSSKYISNLLCSWSVKLVVINMDNNFSKVVEFWCLTLITTTLSYFSTSPFGLGIKWFASLSHSLACQALVVAIFCFLDFWRQNQY